MYDLSLCTLPGRLLVVRPGRIRLPSQFPLEIDEFIIVIDKGMSIANTGYPGKLGKWRPVRPMLPELGVAPAPCDKEKPPLTISLTV